MENCELLGLTKTEKSLLHLIKRNTLNRNTTIKREKKSFNMTNEQMANELSCNTRTIQRGIKKLAFLNLIKRNVPTKKYYRCPHYIAISSDFHIRTKDFFTKEKNVTLAEINVTPIKSISLKTINLPLKNNNNKTKTNINESNVQFFISEKILGIDLKNLDNEIGLTHLDLERLSRKLRYRAEDLQTSVNNYKLALDTGSFCPRIPARAAFIGIHSGNINNPPKLFGLIKSEKEANNKIEKVETEVKALEIETVESKEIQTAKENYWLTLSIEKKNEYLKCAKNLKDAIDCANGRKLIDQQKLSISSFLNKEFEEPSTRGEKINGGASVRVGLDHEEFSIKSIMAMVHEDKIEIQKRPSFLLGIPHSEINFSTVTTASFAVAKNMPLRMVY